MKTEKFKTQGSDFDQAVSERELVGALTKNRYKILMRIVKNYNHNNSTPYGISPNGYAYRCGCEHDCCGCLYSTKMSIDFNQQTYPLFKVTISVVSSYNY